jgi:uncharacterized protein
VDESPEVIVTPWLEVPSSNLARASSFYEVLVGRPLRHLVLEGEARAVFTSSGGGVGAIVARAPVRPEDLLYFTLSSEAELDAWIERAEHAGGDVVLPKTDLGARRAMAIVRDSEGNRLALTSEEAVP